MILDLVSVIAPILVPQGDMMLWSSIYVMYAVTMFPVAAVVLFLAHDWRKRHLGK